MKQAHELSRLDADAVKKWVICLSGDSVKKK
jgi:hypothetical protein